MKKLKYILILLYLTACNHPSKRKETVHCIYVPSSSQYYYITSEITIKEGCAIFKSWNTLTWKYQATYTVCGTYQIEY